MVKRVACAMSSAAAPVTSNVTTPMYISIVNSATAPSASPTWLSRRSTCPKAIGLPPPTISSTASVPTVTRRPRDEW